MAKQKDKAKPIKDTEAKLKRTVGKPKAIESPDVLWQLFKDYMKSAKLSPFLVHDFVGKDASEVRREKERPLSWVGFECYLYDLGIIADLDDYERNTNDSYTAYQPIIRVCKKIIQKDQLEGAAAGVYQQNIVARLLGLADKKDVSLDAEITPTAYKLPDGTVIHF